MLHLVAVSESELQPKSEDLATSSRYIVIHLV